MLYYAFVLHLLHPWSRGNQRHDMMCFSSFFSLPKKASVPHRVVIFWVAFYFASEGDKANTTNTIICFQPFLHKSKILTKRQNLTWLLNEEKQQNRRKKASPSYWATKQFSINTFTNVKTAVSRSFDRAPLLPLTNTSQQSGWSVRSNLLSITHTHTHTLGGGGTDQHQTQ